LEDVRLDSGCLLMMLVKRLVFDDYALVDVLLDSLDEEDVYEIGSRVTHVVVHRLRELLSGDLVAMLDALVEDSLSGWPPLSPLPSGKSHRFDDGSTTEERWRHGVARLETEVDSLLARDDYFSRLGRSCLRQREVFSLIRVGYRAVTQGGVVIPSDLPLGVDLPLVTARQVGAELDGGVVDSLFELLALPARGQVAAVHHANGRLISVLPLKGIGGDDSDALATIAADRQAGLDAQERLTMTWRNLDELLERSVNGWALKSAASQLARNFYRDNILRIAMAMTIGGGTDMKEILRQVDSVLAEDSLIDVIGPVDLRKYAALSLVASSAPNRDGVDTLLGLVGEQYGLVWGLGDFEAPTRSALAATFRSKVLNWIGPDLLLPLL